MAIIDLDSHLRDGWLLHEIYQLPGPFAEYTPKRIGAGKYFYSKLEHRLSPLEDPAARRARRKSSEDIIVNKPSANSVALSALSQQIRKIL